MDDPPNCSQECNTHQDDAVVIHGGDINWQRIWEAVHNVEKYYEDECGKVDGVSSLAQPCNLLVTAFSIFWETKWK